MTLTHSVNKTPIEKHNVDAKNMNNLLFFKVLYRFMSMYPQEKARKHTINFHKYLLTPIGCLVK